MLYVDRPGASSPVTIGAVPRRRITGRYLAHNRLDARARARLADDVAKGHVEITGLTVRQVSRLCRVSIPYINNVRKPPPAPESLAQHFARSTPDERRECARIIGPAIVWDAMISPLI